MNHNKRGEIAMVVALAALVVIGISSFIASNLLKQKFTFLSRAQTSTTWSLDAWDEAANRCPDKGSGLAPCICRELGSDGICAPVGGTNAKGLTCIKNKWDTTWGCWGNPSSANVPGRPDSSSVSGDSCGLTRSQYGTCPDWASENSCHQRLDPPGDPDFGKWFKCVNRWWNGPCESKEVCEGSVAEPPAEAPAVDTSTETPAGPALSGCYNFSNLSNCKSLCLSGRPDVDPALNWYCSQDSDGSSQQEGQWCCPQSVVDATPTPAPGTLDGVCISRGRAYRYCNPGLKCVNSKCVEDISTVTPASTIAPVPPIIITTPIPAVPVERYCSADDRIIEIDGYNFTETAGQVLCGNDVLIYDDSTRFIYRTCQDTSGLIKSCNYACFVYNHLSTITKRVDCLGGTSLNGAPNEYGTNTVRIFNGTVQDITLGSLLITKHQGIAGTYSPIVAGIILKPDVTYTVDFSGTDAGCGTWFNYKTVDAALVYHRLTTPRIGNYIKSDWQWCQSGVNISIVIK